MTFYDIAQLKKYLAESGIALDFHEEAGSTNSIAKELIKDGFSEKTLVLAEMQTAGRGRKGRSFYSPSGTGIYMSVVLPPMNAEVVSLLTVLAAAAVERAIFAETGVHTGIKWVNDLYLNGKKICGILCESIIGKDGLFGDIVGIGINCATENFPEEIKNIAGSIGLSLSREKLIAAIIQNLQKFTKNPAEGMAIYREHCFMRGKKIRFLYDRKEFFGIVEDVDDKGGLVVSCEDGILRTLMSGEAEIIGKDYLK